VKPFLPKQLFLFGESPHLQNLRRSHNYVYCYKISSSVLPNLFLTVTPLPMAESSGVFWCPCSPVGNHFIRILSVHYIFMSKNMRSMSSSICLKKLFCCFNKIFYFKWIDVHSFVKRSVVVRNPPVTVNCLRCLPCKAPEVCVLPIFLQSLVVNVA